MATKLYVEGLTVKGIYTDAFPYHTLGDVTVERASNVEWDKAKGGWVVTLADGTVLPGVYPKRYLALEAEVAEIEARLRAGKI